VALHARQPKVVHEHARVDVRVLERRRRFERPARSQVELLVGVGEHIVAEVVVDVELGGQEALHAGRLVRGADETHLRVGGGVVVQAEGADDDGDVVRGELLSEGFFGGVIRLDEWQVAFPCHGRCALRTAVGRLILVSSPCRMLRGSPPCLSCHDIDLVFASLIQGLREKAAHIA